MFVQFAWCCQKLSHLTLEVYISLTFILQLSLVGQTNLEFARRSKRCLLIRDEIKIKFYFLGQTCSFSRITWCAWLQSLSNILMLILISQGYDLEKVEAVAKSKGKVENLTPPRTMFTCLMQLFHKGVDLPVRGNCG
jgi:hypothetical protein